MIRGAERFGKWPCRGHNIISKYDRGVSAPQTYEALLELDYRLQLAKFADVQPFLKYLTRPNGTGLVQNARMTRQEEGRRAGTPLRRSVLM
ncbi:MAG: hypothetical protein WBL39_14965 [Terrimicrobiaceae bacterium]